MQSVGDQVGGGHSQSPAVGHHHGRSPYLSPVHQEHDDQREEVPLAVHRVQDLHPVWHQRE